MPGGDTINFDYKGAKNAGYSDEEVQGFLKQKYNFQFDITGAKNSGYTDDEIGGYLKAYKPQPIKQQSASDLWNVGISPDETQLKKEQQDRAAQSQQEIPNLLNSKETNKAINKLVQDQYQKSIQGTGNIPTSEKQPIPQTVIKMLPDQVKQNREAFKEVVSGDSDSMRKVLEEAKRVNTNPDFQNKVNFQDKFQLLMYHKFINSLK